MGLFIPITCTLITEYCKTEIDTSRWCNKKHLMKGIIYVMKNDKMIENVGFLKEYLNRYNNEQIKYFIRYLANYYLNTFELYDLTSSFNCLVREIDDTIPNTDSDDEFVELQAKNPYYFLDYLTQQTVIDTLLFYIETCDINQILYVARAFSLVK